MAEITFTSHALDKLQSKALGINRDTILSALKNPLTINQDKNPHQSIGQLSNSLSLVVIWKSDDDIISVITFYPARKGRYESKILSRR